MNKEPLQWKQKTRYESILKTKGLFSSCPSIQKTNLNSFYRCAVLALSIKRSSILNSSIHQTPALSYSPKNTPSCFNIRKKLHFMGSFSFKKNPFNTWLHILMFPRPLVLNRNKHISTLQRIPSSKQTDTSLTIQLKPCFCCYLHTRK